MNKELLVKVWIFLTLLTVVMSVAFSSFNFYTISGPFFIFHIIILISGLVVSLFLIKQKIKFSKHLLALSTIILLVWLIFILFSGCIGCGPPTYKMTILNCREALKMTCERDGNIPLTWNIPNKNILEKEDKLPVSCFELLNCSTCQECGITSP